MKYFFLIDDISGDIVIMDRCTAYSHSSAQKEFDAHGWVIGNVVSEQEYLQQMADEYALYSLEMQTYEG